MKLGAACLLVCAACAVDQAAEIDSYRSLLDASTDPAPDAPDRTLDARAAMRWANAHNEQLSIEGESYLRALIGRRRAAANFLPTLTLSPSYFVRDASPGTDDGIDVPLSGELDVSPRSDLANVERADSEIAQRRALLFTAQDGLLLDVARTLFEVVRAERSARVLESSLEVQQARVDDVRARRDVGFARPLDVSLTESQAADTRVELLEALRQAATGRAMLAFLIDAPLEGVALDGTLEVPDDTPAIDEWRARAHAQRQDLVAAAAGVEGATHVVRIATGEWWPSISVSLDAFLTRESAPSNEDWRGFIAISLPLFSAGRIRADVRDALSFLRQAELEQSLAQRGVDRDVEVAWENLTSSRERLERLRVRLTVAREAFEQANGLYDAGLATNLERLAAQQEQLQTELALESAELERRVFYLDLLRASGALHEWAGLVRPAPQLEPAEEAPRAEAR